MDVLSDGESVLSGLAAPNGLNFSSSQTLRWEYQNSGTHEVIGRTTPGHKNLSMIQLVMGHFLMLSSALVLLAGTSSLCRLCGGSGARI